MSWKSPSLTWAVLLLAGCAGKDVPSQSRQPVNGRCGVEQDVCLLGTPSGTGDTTPPYEWMCLGSHGGTSASCSVPTAKIEDGEIFAGKNALAERVKAAGPMRGFFTVLDTSLNEPDCVSLSCHARLMERYALDMGIPEENLNISPTASPFDFLEGWGGDSPTVRSDTLVISIPSDWVTVMGARDLIPLRSGRSSFLVVSSAGNSDGGIGRDAWYPDHHWWRRREHSWKHAMASFKTGRHILAKYVQRGADGTVSALWINVKCGLAKEYCYSIIHDGVQNQGSSGASVNLGALVFYLFQLWDTPRQVVRVLNTCAEDVGEPGIDEEFGRGVVSVVCDTVRNRERGVVAGSVSMIGTSPVLARMTGEYGFAQAAPEMLFAKPQPVSVSSGRFRPFYAFRGYSPRTFTGHLGGQFSLKGTDVFVSGGADYAPLGVRSSLLHTVRIPFMELGARRRLLARGGHAVTLLGTYGYSEGTGLSAHVGSLGVRYERLFGFGGSLAGHAGYQQVQGAVGIPGYRDAGAEPVPFVDGNAEARFWFSLGL